MSANPAVMEGARGTAAAGMDERIHIPARWRMGQGVVIALILLLAAWYNTVGWKSPAGESGAADSRTLFDQIGFVILIGLTWLTTPTAGTIAMTTWQEALRRRWMTALMAFALVLLGLSMFFTWMQPGEEEKFLRDFGIGFIVIITTLMSIFLGVALVPPDIERRTIFTILSKPVNRLEFLLGKFLGLSLTLAVNLALMSVMFLLSYILFQLRKSGWNWGAAWAVDPSSGLPGLGFDVSNLSRALTLQFGQLTIMAALALTLSLVVSNITAIVFCFLAYFGGQTSSYWEHLGSEHGGDEHGDRPGLSGPVARLVQMVYYVLPRLDRFEVRERLVNDMAIGSNYMWKAFDSGLIYVAVLLTIAYLIFSDREF